MEAPVHLRSHGRNYLTASKFRQKVELLLARADVHIGGGRPWDLQVHHEEFYQRVLADGSLGLGESYMDGWWNCQRLDEFFYKILRAGLEEQARDKVWFLDVLKAKVYNYQKPSRAFKIGRHHYDMGNRLYQCMLDDYMVYSCGYWDNASSLAEAQLAKLDLVCRKLKLQPGMRLLDIGCGWGGTAKFAAENYGVEVVGITVSEEQVRYAREFCRGLPVDIRLQDYRTIQGTFDRILSIGMFEHVGLKNYANYMRLVRAHLREDGLFLLQTIGRNRSGSTCDRWISEYIFPNSMLPSATQICAALEGLFVIEDWQSFGADYDKTLMAWFQNFDDNWHLLEQEYDERFYRMWKYYLLSCAGSFRARQNQLWQLVLSPRGIVGGYRAPR
ncbi:MAG: cyclopropane fatty acyl phospholipid synthase [Deltaproteobacteria bacterium]|nr:cyclopropane fatty acyl phospholipid synthase [Deltaproteobacteria bacterium]MBW2071948.1 cyclopropane fatty acyl phospholipid synthase [Deltaproteobacteria bacterium]